MQCKMNFELLKVVLKTMFVCIVLCSSVYIYKQLLSQTTDFDDNSHVLYDKLNISGYENVCYNISDGSPRYGYRLKSHTFYWLNTMVFASFGAISKQYTKVAGDLPLSYSNLSSESQMTLPNIDLDLKLNSSMIWCIMSYNGGSAFLIINTFNGYSDKFLSNIFVNFINCNLFLYHHDLVSVFIINRLNRKRTIYLSRFRLFKHNVGSHLIIKLLLLIAGVEQNPGPDFICSDQNSHFQNLFLNLQNLILDFTTNLADRLTIIDNKLDFIKTKVDCVDTTTNLNDIRRSLDDFTENTINLDSNLNEFGNDSSCNEKWESPKRYGYINGKKEFDIPTYNRFDPFNSSSFNNTYLSNDYDTKTQINQKVNQHCPAKSKPCPAKSKPQHQQNKQNLKKTKVKILSDSVLKNVGSNIESRSNLKVSSTILSGGGVFNIYNLGFTLSETDKICVISLGGNDLKNCSVNMILDELYNVLNYFKYTYPDKTFVFGSIIPRSDINSKIIAMFNFEIRKFCRISGILFCDYFNSFSKFYYHSDGIHLNNKGINKLGLIYSNFLSKVFLIKDLG